MTAEFVVVKENGDTLLSRKTATELGVLKMGLNIHNVSSDPSCETNNTDIIREFESLFKRFGKL